MSPRNTMYMVRRVITKKKSTMKGSAGVASCGHIHWNNNASPATMTEKTMMRNENFLIGIFLLILLLFLGF